MASASDPNTGLTSANLEQRLEAIMQLPHNQAFLRQRGITAAAFARNAAGEIRAGFVGQPQPVTVTGPKRLLRGTDKTPAGSQQGARNPFGNWWFEEELLVRIAGRLKPWPMPAETKAALTHQRLRDALAVALNWNPLAELWCLDKAGRLEPTSPGTPIPHRLLCGQATLRRSSYFLIQKGLTTGK